MTEAESREFSGTIVRGTIEWIEKAGLTERVRKEVPADTAALIQRPPLSISWVDARHMDQLLGALERVAGTEVVVTYGLEATRRSFGPVLSPMLRGMVGMFGATPASIFGHLDRIASLMIRGATYSYQATRRDRGRAHGPQRGPPGRGLVSQLDRRALLRLRGHPDEGLGAGVEAVSARERGDLPPRLEDRGRRKVARFMFSSAA